MRSFKRILRTVLAFLLLVALISGGLIACYLRGENFHYQDQRERDRLSGTLDVLAAGASYALMGIHPETLDQAMGVNSYILAGTMLTLPGRMELLRQELPRNPVRLVLLEVSPEALTQDREAVDAHGDMPMLGRITDPGRRWSYFRENIRVREYPQVYYDMVSKGVDSFIALVTGRYATENHSAYKGYYLDTKTDQPIPADDKSLLDLQTIPQEIQPENVEHLRQMVALCRENGATPILITPPQTNYYNCVNGNLDLFQTWFAEFAREQGTVYLNFNLHREKQDLLDDQVDFYDEGHLNQTGAPKFTRLLAEVLTALDRGEDVSARFYSSYADLKALRYGE